MPCQSAGCCYTHFPIDVIRGCTHKKERTQKKKVPRGFFQNLSSGTWKLTLMGADASPPLADFTSMPSSSKSTLLVSSAWHSYKSRTVQASQWHRGNTTTCHCEAGIASPALPGVKTTPNHTKTPCTQTLHNENSDIIVTKRSSTRKDAVPPGKKTPNPFLRPLWISLLPYFVWAGFAQAADPHARSTKKYNEVLLIDQGHHTTTNWSRRMR